MNETARITVLLVDDHVVVLQGIRAFLQTTADIEVVGTAERGGEAIELAKRLQPKVMLLDMLLPDIDGVEVARQVHGACAETQIVVFTSFHEDQHIFPVLRAGALSYLLKDARPEEITEAIRKAARKEAVLDSRVAARVVRELQGGNQDQVNPFILLSNRELEVLRLLATGAANQEIADRLVIGESTVKSHVGSILSKLHLTDRTQAAVYAWAMGIMRQPENLNGSIQIT